MRFIQYFLLSAIVITCLLCPLSALAANNEPLELLNLSVLENKQGAEILCMNFSRYVQPEINTLDNGRPRVYFDLANVVKWDGKTKYPVKGNMITRVRTSYDKGKKRLRIVLDLDEKYNYAIQPSGVEEEKIFCLGFAITGNR